MKDWYNVDLKRDFINQYQGTVAKNTFASLFGRSALMESDLKKDCSQFSLEQIYDLARSYRSADVSSIRIKMSLLRTYTAFCINNGFSKTKINHYTEIPSDAYESFIDRKMASKMRLSKDEVYDILDAFENARDKFIILAPYEGIYGADMCELLELREKDVLPGNKLRLCTGRIVKISDALYDIIMDCISEDTAIYGGKEKKLEKTDRVYKNLVMLIASPPTKESIIRRYYIMREQIGRETLGVKMLFNSGFLNALDEVVLEKGSFDNSQEEVKAVQERYGNSWSFGRVKRFYK